MTLRSTLRTAALVGLLSGASLVAVAMPGAGNHHNGDACGMAAHQHGMGAMHQWHGALHRLNLSDAQHDQVFELMHGQAKERHSLMRQLRQVQADLRSAAQAPQFDDAKAQALAHEQAKLTAQQLLLDVQLESKIRALLTPEQRQQLNQRPAGHHGMGMGPHGTGLHRTPMATPPAAQP